jgi:hypothetical protein
MKNSCMLFAVILFSLASCNKYPDGPALSLRSRTARVVNIWKVENYMINGKDHTSLLAGYTERYAGNGDYSYVFGKSAGTGTWNFQNKDAEINLTGLDNMESRVMVILKLENNSFWYYYIDGDDYKEVHLVPAL